VSILVPLVALGLPIADTLLAIVRRALRGRPLFSADKEHIHHRLLALGLSQREAVIVLYGACIVLGASALILSYANSAETAAVLTLLSLVGFFAVRRLGVLREPVRQARAHNRELRAAVREIAALLQQAKSQGQLWDAAKAFCAAVGASRMSMGLSAPRPDGERVTTLWQLDGTAGEHPPFTAAFLVDDDAGKLELRWEDGRTQIDRDDEIATEILCDHLATSLARLSGSPAQQQQVIPLQGRERRK
jgi:UDP-GlcNAc:undecaprenyl-phosphate GlcNAc-1-phosphate transferase